jgi:DNA-binding PucR family transcriptional regulator
VCAWLERAPTGGDSVDLLEAAIGELAHALGVDGALVQPLGLLDAAGWIASQSELDLAPLDHVRLDAERFPGVRLAVGEPARGLAGFRTTHFEALNARRVATLSDRATGTVTRYGLVALQALAAADIDQARAFVARELGALDADDDTSRRLAATLRVYLDEHASRSRAAKRLGIHENTISYRVRRAEEILGRSVDEDTLNLRVALAVAGLSRTPRAAVREAK